MARVFTAKKSKAGKKINCKRCNAKIKPGDNYYFYTRRFSRSKRARGTKFTHCMNCKPRHSDLSSSPMAEIYDAQEDAHRAIDMADNGPDMMSAIEDLKAAAEDVKERAEESLENMPEGLRENSDSGQTLQERIDALEEYISELEGVDVSNIEEPEEPEAGEDAGKEEDVIEEDPIEDAREECRNAIDSLSI